MTDYVLCTVRIPSGKPGLAEAARAAGVVVDKLDPAFGVCPVDPAENLFAIRVEATTPAPGVEGPYSNPRIATFE